MEEALSSWRLYKCKQHHLISNQKKIIGTATSAGVSLRSNAGRTFARLFLLEVRRILDHIYSVSASPSNPDPLRMWCSSFGSSRRIVRSSSAQYMRCLLTSTKPLTQWSFPSLWRLTWKILSIFVVIYEDCNATIQFNSAKSFPFRICRGLK